MGRGLLTNGGAKAGIIGGANGDDCVCARLAMIAPNGEALHSDLT
jgi:hypothetical protein